MIHPDLKPLLNLLCGGHPALRAQQLENLATYWDERSGAKAEETAAFIRQIARRLARLSNTTDRELAFEIGAKVRPSGGV